MRINRSIGLALLVCSCVGCAHTQDVSNTPEYKPWIGKTVCLTEQRNVFSAMWGPYFLDEAESNSDCSVVARLPEGYPVVIEAVMHTQGRYLLDHAAFVDDELVLSIELPGKNKKRITVWSDLSDVEPFKDKDSHRILIYPD